MASERVLLAGLGNPGPKYAGNRHNIGYMAIDAVMRRHGFGALRTRFHGEIAAGRLAGREALALKPATFMNESGRSVAAAARFYKVPVADLFVFHDELDLAAGKVRVKRGGGAAGHNGLRSIDAHLGTDYWRVRLGIGRPGDKRRVLGHVLEDFDEADRRWLDAVLQAVAEQTSLLVAGDPSAFASKVALALNPPRPKPPPTPRPSPRGEGASKGGEPSPEGEGGERSERVRGGAEPSPLGEGASEGGEPSPQPSPRGEGASESERVRGAPPRSRGEP